MLRVTIDILPGGLEMGRRTVGLIEIANTGQGTDRNRRYRVLLKKTPPFDGALVRNWKAADLDPETGSLAMALLADHDPQARGVYDVLYRALSATVGPRSSAHLEADARRSLGATLMAGLLLLAQ